MKHIYRACIGKYPDVRPGATHHDIITGHVYTTAEMIFRVTVGGG